MVVYQLIFPDILARLNELTRTLESAQDDIICKNASEHMWNYFHAFEHFCYCIQTNGILLNDAGPVIRSENMEQLRSFFSPLFARESKVRLDYVMTTLTDFRVSPKNKKNNPCILLDRKNILSYFYSPNEKSRQQNTLVCQLNYPSVLDDFLLNFLQYTESCIICEPNLGEWLGEKKSNWKITGLAIFIKTILSVGVDLKEIILVTKKKYTEEDINPGVAMLEKLISGSKRVPICRLKQFEESFLGHDRFFVNDLFFCSFGRGFELYSSKGKLLPDINVFWGGPKSKFGNMWKAIEKQEAIATF